MARGRTPPFATTNACDWSASNCGDEAAVDPQIGSGDVGGPVAGQEHDQVGNLPRRGEPAHGGGWGKKHYLVLIP